MKLEKTFVLSTGRTVKVITKVPLPVNLQELKLNLDVLVKDPGEEEFRPSIGQTHPKYWKLKKLNPIETKMVELKYSGISDKQIRNAFKEFKQILCLEEEPAL